MDRSRGWSFLCAAGLLSACQVVGGFEDFKAASSSTGGRGNAGGAGSGGVGQGAGGVSADIGASCAREEDCDGSVCVLGVCRLACDDDSDCNDGQLCIEEGGRSGCRVSGELSCATVGQPCASNPGLTCALDLSCRPPCAGDADCPIAPQTCIAGTCVGSDEPGTGEPWFECTTGRSCESGVMVSCNETSVGRTVLATCDNDGLCEAGKASGACGAPTCTPGVTRCFEASVQRCDVDGVRYDAVSGLGPCASTELCEITRGKANATACEPPACSVGERRCHDGKVESCDTSLVRFSVAEDCVARQLRCDAGAGACVDFAIDATEVSRDDYQAFLASAARPTPPAACATNSYVPEASCTPVCQGAGCGNHPQVCVDWCDAWGYCAARGQRLCGRVGGGVLSFAQFADPGRSEWTNACTSGGQHVYPYAGERTNDAACRGSLLAAASGGGTTFVGDLAGTCRSPVVTYAAALNLSGNVAEWDDSCEKPASEPSADGTDLCHVRGGSYASANDALACATTRTLGRSQASPEVGFRCCGTPDADAGL